MNNLVAFLRERRNLPKVRVKASAVLEAFGETAPEALVGRRLPVPAEGGTVEYRISEYLIQQDAFVVMRVSDVARPDLVAFLNARYDEEEAQADVAAQHQKPDWSCPATCVVDLGEDLLSIDDREVAYHIVLHDPARVLAEVEANRRTLDLHFIQSGTGGTWDTDPPAICNECGTPHPCETVRLRGLPHADHEDYRQEWKP